MKTLLIHIGYHKTATTSIQKFLHDNASALGANGISYARTGRAGTSHSLLANCLKPESRNRPASRELWAQLLAEVSESNCPRTLISSECFLEGKGIPAALAALSNGKVNVEIICYLRPQLDWLESLYNEIVKDPYRRYTGNVYGMREVKLGWIDYHSILGLWSNAFGSRALHVRPFQRRRLKNGSIYDDVLGVLGISALPQAILPPDQNVSLHPVLTEFLRRCNTIPMLNPVHAELVATLQELSNRCSIALPAVPQEFRRLAPPELEALRARIEPCNLDLSQLFCKPDVAFFDPTGSTEGDLLDPPQLLSPVIEHDIFDRLPAGLQSQLEQTVDSISTRAPRKSFLPEPPLDLEARLTAVIIRQRIEARILYSQLAERRPGLYELGAKIVRRIRAGRKV